MLKEFFKDKLVKALLRTSEKGVIQGVSNLSEFEFNVEVSKNFVFGDFACNVSSLARYAKLPPVKIAELLALEVDCDGFEVNTVQGFINFMVGQKLLDGIVCDVLKNPDTYGGNALGAGEKIILEYVSANPTGPFHIGHGRWAAMGSALASLMKFCGYDVFQEFYINDAGVQIRNLTHSLLIRVKQELGFGIDFPQDEELQKSFYKGEYLLPIAKKFTEKNVELAASLPDDYKQLSTEQFDELSLFARTEILNSQQQLLTRFNVNFDKFYSELDLHNLGKVEESIKSLDKAGMLYEKDGALWFKSSQFGDDQDRVLKKQDGYYTYLTADIAYHFDKIDRGFDKMINIWGADHHGYVPRMKASIEALGKEPEMLEVLLGQLVNIIIQGEQVRMGKRTKMLTLDELIEEVGVDATRFWMIFRSIDTTLDFDVDLAKSNTDENPVFYVQYAHARACSILRNACNERVDVVDNAMKPAVFTADELDNSSTFIDKLWTTDDEKAHDSAKRLILKLEEFQSLIVYAAQARAPYVICKYLSDLAQAFHQFYSCSRVLCGDRQLSLARLTLVKACISVLRIGLEILAVNAPERM